MTIPESQFETWSHQGAVSSSKSTHVSIRMALDQYEGYPDNINFDVYLQGSYKNDTNIRGQSDVDVVVMLKSSFYGDISGLPSEQQSLYKTNFGDATYNWPNFRADVFKALEQYYGHSEIKEGRKSIKIRNSTGNRLPADVVVCMEFRKYLKFLDYYSQEYIDGIEFFVPSENRWIVSYPKCHYENSIKKNSANATNGLYKPVVRIFKNARSYLIDHNVISDELAPSYFLEGLIYNVPNENFVEGFRETVYNILKWLSETDYGQFVSPSEQQLLFGNSPEQWNMSNAHQLVSSFIKLWNDW